MKKTDVVIIDYGVGNLFNLRRAFNTLGVNSMISNDKEEILLREVRVDQLNDGTWIDLPARGGWLGWFPLDEIDVVDIR